MPHDLSFTLILLGRLFLGGYFLSEGIRNFRKIAVLDEVMRIRKAPQPWLLLRIGLAVEVIGGALVAFSIFPVIGAILLAIFTVCANAILHSFWELEGEERIAHVDQILASVGLIGGLLIVIATA